MRAVYFPEPRVVEVREVPIPQPSQGEVRIQLKASAICRSDMSLFHGKSVVRGEHAGTIIPGHEPCGIVDSLGEGVSNLKIGDRVAVYLAIGCGSCSYCLSGYKMFCKTWKCLGDDWNGGDADYMVVPEENCMPIPDEMSFEVGAVSTDAIGTLYHAQKRLGISGKDTLVIFGLGPMGAAGIMVAKGLGARVIAVDVVTQRLELAKEIGADEVIDGKNENVVEKILELTGRMGADAFIDCSGSTICHNQALDSVRPHGRGAFIGESKESTIKPSAQLIRKQVTLMGSWYFPIHEFSEIANFIVSKKVPVEKLITHRFPITEAETAFRLFDEHKTEKVVFEW
jgi:threonine dehydrogenase-like Zn-dependent dehydrogenase